MWRYRRSIQSKQKLEWIHMTLRNVVDIDECFDHFAVCRELFPFPSSFLISLCILLIDPVILAAFDEVGLLGVPCVFATSVPSLFLLPSSFLFLSLPSLNILWYLLFLIPISFFTPSSFLSFAFTKRSSKAGFYSKEFSYLLLLSWVLFKGGLFSPSVKETQISAWLHRYKRDGATFQEGSARFSQAFDLDIADVPRIICLILSLAGVKQKVSRYCMKLKGGKKWIWRQTASDDIETSISQAIYDCPSLGSGLKDLNGIVLFILARSAAVFNY
ncbi:hypothetical protein LXL04_030854 [Taraxacum kok-saghyz]